MKWIKASFSIFWSSFITSIQAIRVLYYMSRLSGPIITVFGGTEVDQDHIFSKKAYELAGKCVAQGMSILTGGGPGIMLAANCGAQAQAKKENIKKPTTIGVGVRGLDKGFVNTCAKRFNLHNFFIRKWFLMQCSRGFIIFPGGIGTVDEFLEVLNLIKLEKIKPVPVVLFDVAYWQPLIEWFMESGIEHGFIKPEHQKLFIITDDIDQALDFVRKGCFP